MQLRYIEYGKIFLESPKGALEYSPLDRSDNELIRNTQEFYLQEVATFGTESEDNTQLRDSISFALIPWDKIHFLFIQLQRRREDEFVDRKKYSPETHRPFNQARFTVINKKEIDPKSFSLSQSLIFENPEYPGKMRLSDYLYPRKGKVEKLSFISKKIGQNQAFQKTELLRKIMDTIFIKSLPGEPNKESTNRSLRTIKPIHIKATIPLIEKIYLFDELQYWLYPAFGPITFSSDYINNREVNFVLAERTPEWIESDYSFNVEFLNFFNESYFDAVTNLKEEELYSEVFEYYIRIAIWPKESVTLFKLIETDQKFSDEEELHLINNYIEQIRDKDISKIINKRFNEYEKLLKLIPILSIANFTKRIIILQHVLNKVNKELSKYYRFHLAAINDLNKNGSNITHLRKFLIDSVKHTSPEELNTIQETDRENLYQELIWADYNLSIENENYSKEFEFQFSGTDNYQKHSMLFYVLMERKEEAFFHSIHKLSTSKISTHILEKIINCLEDKRLEWDITIVIKFWNPLPSKSLKLFLILLKHLINDRKNHDAFSKYPLLLNKFLTDGEGLLYQSDQDHTNKNKSLKLSGKLVSYLDNKTLTNLRLVSLITAYPISNDNILFGYWWLSEELLYSTEEILKEDYKKLLKSYVSIENNDLNETAIKYAFLLSGGKTGSDLSVHECINSVNNYKQSHQINKFYFTILSVWAKEKHIIPSLDIIQVVQGLPNELSQTILKDILHNKKKSQIIEITKIEPEVALKWLNYTKRVRLLDSSGNDILFMALLNLQNPTIDFVRHMLLYEEPTYDKAKTWAEYSKRIKAIYHNKWSTKYPDTFIESYIRTTSYLHSSLNIEKYRSLIIMLAQEDLINQESLLKEVPLVLIIDFIKENKNLDSDLKPKLNAYIKTCLQKYDLKTIISRLDQNSIKHLQEYILNEDVLREVYGKDIRRVIVDPQNNKTIYARLGNIYEPQFLVKQNLLRKNLENEVTDQSSSLSKGTSFSVLEIFLVGILILIVIVIIFLIIIAFSKTLFDIIWTFLKSRGI